MSSNLTSLAVLDKNVLQKSLNKFEFVAYQNMLYAKKIEDDEKIEFDIVITGICKTLSIKSIDESQLKILGQHIRFFHGDLTVLELIFCFESVEVGLFDDYLTRDKNNEPERNHYGAFDIAYLNRVIRAYRKYKDNLKNKVGSFLPPTYLRLDKHEKTEEEKNKEAMANFRPQIVSFYDYYIEHGILVDNVAWNVVYKELCRVKLIDHQEQFTESDVNKAILNLCDRFIIGKIDRLKVNKESIIKNREKNEFVKQELGVIVRDKKIQKAFDFVFQSKIDLLELLNREIKEE